MSYQTTSAVLLLVYNRPEITARVLEAIQAARPTRLYVAADGPSPGNEETCEEVKKLIGKTDWNCTVKTRYIETHLGCGDAVSSSVSWFFEQEEEGIILEDDCIPSAGFFWFCDTLLEHYRNDERITIISGSNLQHGKKWGDAAYYFSNLTHVWGWASWRRVWQQYDKTLASYTKQDIARSVDEIFNEPVITKAWQEKFNGVKSGAIDTWDYQFTFMNFFNRRLSIIPNVNLVTNIGFGGGATHTIDTQSRNANIPHGALGEITHPAGVTPQKQADLFTLNEDFDVARLKAKEKKLHRRAKRWFKNLVK